MPLPLSVGANLTSRCINPLLQRPLFLCDESLLWPFQHCLDLVKIHLEASDTWCMNFVRVAICPMRCRCYCSVQICAPYWADFWQPLWWTFSLKSVKLQEARKSQFGTPWLLQRAAITLASAACNLFFPDVLDPLTFDHVHSTFSCDRASVCVGMCWP